MKLLILDSTATVKNYEHIFQAANNLDYNILGFISLDNQRIFETVEGYTIYPLDYIKILNYDFALLNTYFDAAQNIIPELAKLNIPIHKVRTVYWLLQQIMIKKYEDIQDPVIQETLHYWNNHELTIFNQYTENYAPTFDEMFFDENCGLPFIMFETVEGKKRRMYFPKNGGPQQRVRTPDGKFFIKDILREQVPTSPHLYITEEHKINDGDILIDAGVCEGNFALRYVDICSKVYLFEPDKNWAEPLFYSFRDCWDKIEFIPQFVSDSTQNGGGGR